MGRTARSIIQKFLAFALALSMVFTLAACSFFGRKNADDQRDETEEQLVIDLDDGEEIMQYISNMSLRDKVGQLFMIRPDQLCFSESSEYIHTSDSGVLSLTDEMILNLEDYPAGGFVLFDKNIESPLQIAAFTEDLKASCSTAPFIAADEEGGVVTRIAHARYKGFELKTYESMESIGRTGDTENAKEAGSYIGTYMREYGFDLNLAPVADVNTNPKNIVIGNRSFGNDPNLVSEMVRAYIEGLHSAGVLSCTKHFPGHGDTTSDTHTGRVVLYKTWDELLTSELIPFKETMDETDIIMIAHITLPEVTGDGLPASMSGELIQGKLRGELGYDGVVVTDSMAMKAVADYYGPGEAAITAIEAGADIVLMPFDYKEAFDAVYDAVLSGRLSEERIDVSVCRILKLKIVN